MSYTPSEKFPTVESRINWLYMEISQREARLEQTSNPVKLRERTKTLKNYKSELKSLESATIPICNCLHGVCMSDNGIDKICREITNS